MCLFKNSLRHIYYDFKYSIELIIYQTKLFNVLTHLYIVLIGFWVKIKLKRCMQLVEEPKETKDSTSRTKTKCLKRYRN